MSKAFTKEPDGGLDDDDDEQAEEAERAKGRSGRNYVTRAGHERLSAELERLWHVERPRVTEEVSAAAAQGDRSENAEYIYGKKKLREIDRRVRFLRKRLEVLVVVEPSREQEGRVYFGARVSIEDEDGKRSTYRIVGPDEIDLKAGDISIEAPLARALLGHAVGDEVIVDRPRGRSEVVIVAIAYDLRAPEKGR
jgi:transcription elongation factor GreB